MEITETAGSAALPAGRSTVSLLAQAAVVAAVGYVLLLATMSPQLGLYDEAIPLVGAMRVATGEVPHRDFYSIYGPAPYYLLAEMSRLGPLFLVERLLDAAFKAAILGTLFYLTRRHAGPRLAIFATFAVAAWFVGVGAYGYVVFPVLLIGLVSTALLVPRSGGLLRGDDAFGAGALVGLSALFRYDTAAFIVLAHMAAAAVLSGMDREPDRLRRLGSFVALYTLGCAGAFLPFALLFLSSAPLSAMIGDVIGLSSGGYVEMRRLPWPDVTQIAASPDRAAVYLPFVALIFVVATLRSQNSRRDPRLVGFLVLFSSLDLAFILKGVVRVSVMHMLMAIVVSVLLLAVLVHVWLREQHALRRIGASAVLVIVSLLAVFTLPVRLAELGRPNSPRWSPDSADHLPPPYGEAARFIASQTPPDERIFVGRTHHDRLPHNALGMYVATDRLPATHWHQFDPGLQTAAATQKAIVGELERGRVRWLVLDSREDSEREPNGSATSSGAFLLDHYISAKYAKVRDWGVVQAWRRTSP